MSQLEWMDKVLISAEDVIENVENFRLLGFDIPEEIETMLGKYRGTVDPLTLEDQKLVCKFILSVMANRAHPMLQDECFDNISAESKESLVNISKLEEGES